MSLLIGDRRLNRGIKPLYNRTSTPIQPEPAPATENNRVVGPDYEQATLNKSSACVVPCSV